MALEQHACSVVMGLHQPGDPYDTCVRSLNRGRVCRGWASTDPSH
jgi:hypothetical protein